MSKRQYIFYILNQLYYRSFHRQPEDKYMLGILYICAGGIAVFAFAFILSTLDIFIWLMYGAMSVGVILEVIVIAVRIKSITEQMKEKRGNNDAV